MNQEERGENDVLTANGVPYFPALNVFFLPLSRKMTHHIYYCQTLLVLAFFYLLKFKCILVLFFKLFSVEGCFAANNPDLMGEMYWLD